jgi:hypothetical protein
MNLRVFSLTALLFLASPAMAADSADLHPVYDHDGGFAYCVASLPMPNGRRLSIARSKSDETNLGVTIPKGGFKVGAQYDLDVALPPAAPRRFRAIAMESDSLLLQLGGNQLFFKNLLAAKTLEITGGANKLTFDLTAAHKTLAGLDACVAKGKTAAPAPKPEPTPEKAGKGATAHAAKTDAPSPALLPPNLRAILLEAGVDPLVPIDMRGLSDDQRPADFAWRSGPLLGGVRERDVPKNKTLDDLTGLYLSGLKAKCQGTFASKIDRPVKIADLSFVTAEADCRMKIDGNERSIAAEILFYLTKAGRLTIFTHEGDAADAPRARTIRDKLAASFEQAAKKVAGQK